MKALDKYLKYWAEAEASALRESTLSERWAQVLVIPAYAESSAFLDRLPEVADTLLVLVLNRPDSEPDASCNDDLRGRVLRLREMALNTDASLRLFRMQRGNHLLLVERPRALPRREGVGLARKIGCDLALALFHSGRIASRWIHCSDADATLPAAYFSVVSQTEDAVALTYPYRHERPPQPRTSAAVDVYERYLHAYVEGLRQAGSPYAFHTLGSCIAVDARAYAEVRGVPRRAGGEDFYLLNKLAKLGAIHTPRCPPIALSGRDSLRAPFGTGPAITRLLQGDDPHSAAIFYHPLCFDSLRHLLRMIARHGRPGVRSPDLGIASTPEIGTALSTLKFESFLEHSARHCADAQAFQRQFHQWFDGFRTLRFIHALCAHWPRLSMRALDSL